MKLSWLLLDIQEFEYEIKLELIKVINLETSDSI